MTTHKDATTLSKEIILGDYPLNIKESMLDQLINLSIEKGKSIGISEANEIAARVIKCEL